MKLIISVLIIILFSPPAQAEDLKVYTWYPVKKLDSAIDFIKNCYNTDGKIEAFYFNQSTETWLACIDDEYREIRRYDN